MKVILRRLFSDTNKKRIKELIRYGIVGASTTIINLLAYHFFLLFLDYKIANLIALVISKAYGYFANKNIVFHSRTDSFVSFIWEVLRFVFARGITAIVDYFGLILAVDVLGFDKIISKYVLQIVIIALNYVLGKHMVFRQRKGDGKIMGNRKVQDYNTGNIDKYQTKNVLKRKMISNFHQKLIYIIGDIMEIEKIESPKVLDAGCGEGFFTATLHEAFPQMEIVGCDGAEEALAIARKIDPKAIFEKANLYELPYRDYEFDLVICSEVLEHLQEPAEALKELCRTGKRVLITVPNEPWFRLGNLVAFHNVLRLGDPIDHINHWTFGGFKRFVHSVISGNDCCFDRSFPWSIFWK